MIFYGDSKGKNNQKMYKVATQHQQHTATLMAATVMVMVMATVMATVMAMVMAMVTATVMAMVMATVMAMVTAMVNPTVTAIAMEIALATAMTTEISAVIVLAMVMQRSATAMADVAKLTAANSKHDVKAMQADAVSMDGCGFCHSCCCAASGDNQQKWQTGNRKNSGMATINLRQQRAEVAKERELTYSSDSFNEKNDSEATINPK